MDFEFDSYVEGEDGPFDFLFGSDELLGGDANTPPLVSDVPETSQDSPYGGLLDFLGSIGTTARNIGTAVGTFKRDVASARINYNTARTNAATGNSIGQWWQYSTTQDKMMVALGVGAIIVVLIVKR